MKNTETIRKEVEGKNTLSRKETAIYLGVSLGTLDRSGIPHGKIGNRCVYSKSVLDSIILGKGASL